MTQERRRYVRINKGFKVSYLEVGDHLKGEAQSRNISEGGICLPLDRHFGEGTFLELEIYPEELKAPIKALARIVWITDRHAGRLPFEAGFQFLEIAPDQRDKLRDYIKRFLAQGGEGVRWIE